MDAYKAGKDTVIIEATDFRLAEVLSHIEAGKIVLIVPPGQRPPQAA